MKRIKTLMTLLAMMVALTASAQERDYHLYPYGFVGIQGGLMKNYSGTVPERKIAPEAALSLGYFFSQEVGTRLTGAGTMWKVDTPDGEYDSKMLDLSLDLLLNFSNILFPNRHNAVNVIGVFGMPWQIITPHTYIDTYGGTQVQDYDKWNRGWKGGGMLEFDIAKHWGLNIEAGSIYMNNRQHSAANTNRWWPYAMAGLSYKFGFKKKHVAEPVVEEYVAPEPEPAPAPAPKPVVVEKKEEPAPAPAPAPKAPAKIEKNIFFALNKADLQSAEKVKINDIVEFAKANPEAKFTVTGYADKGTGNATVNKRVAERRAQTVKTQLVYGGVEATRITTDAKGDTVQPFANNDENRVVIVVGKE